MKVSKASRQAWRENAFRPASRTSSLAGVAAVDAATADEIEAAVALCPSGALRTRRRRAHKSARPTETRVRASSNGPLLVTGGVRVLDADGNVLYEGERAALCRCGGSANKPFCDGTHKTNGFSG